MIRCYSELIKIPDFAERYQYLRLGGKVGASTFGFDRWLNQVFYHTDEWRALRREVILRDEGFDLAHQDYPLDKIVYVHHMNPLTEKDVLNRTEYLLNPEYLICASFNTHQAIHYGDESLLPIFTLVERAPNDTCPWR